MKRVLVTGGGQGIGLAFVKEFISNGLEVDVIDKQNLPNDIQKLGIADHYFQTTLNQHSNNLDELLNITAKNKHAESKKIGHYYDYIVLSHGVEDENSAIDNNLYGLWAIEDGIDYNSVESVLLVLSTSAHTGMENRAYASSKGAGLAYMRYLANQYPKTRINSISPGAVITPMNQTILNDQDKFNAVANENLMQRWATSQEIAHAGIDVLTMTFVTGQDLIMDGGELVKFNEIR